MQLLHMLLLSFGGGPTLYCMSMTTRYTFKRLVEYPIILEYSLFYFFWSYGDYVYISMISIIAGLLMRVRLDGAKSLLQVKIVCISIPHYMLEPLPQHIITSYVNPHPYN